ncbi:RNA polymerase sigma factor [Bradyrhizobium sp. WSM3983]|uniref:RNA polymerase sigma factor n=1 Tax=Bradyrhizobium sp. WSM3983 TaxID=1038867 RepID=UPI000406D5BF|nr:RNA polymerase sigma factor [Bradyrhizobium sp. WSM3983]
MATDNLGILRDLLLAEYHDLNRRLSRRLGSAENASEVLHETYLRLEKISEIAEVRSPKAYLFRIALNIANDRRRSEIRRLTTSEIETLLEIPDDQPDAARVIEDRSEIKLLRRAIAELPERRRRALLLSRVEGMTNREIAELLGVTVRTIETDLKQAIEHCAHRLKRPARDKFGFQPPASSYVQRQVVRGKPLPTGICGEALGRAQERPTSRPVGVLGS